MVETVKFNVGGKHFEVSRALINQHPNSMLAKMISETWEKEKGEPLFVDRDGDKFAVVLDYMRYGSIILPPSIPRAMFDRELDYYGVTVMTDSLTTIKELTYFEYKRENIERLEQLKTSVTRHEMNANMLTLAVECHYQLFKCNAGKESLCFESRVDSFCHHLWDSKKEAQELLKQFLDHYFGLTLEKLVVHTLIRIVVTVAVKK